MTQCTNPDGTEKVLTQPKEEPTGRHETDFGGIYGSYYPPWGFN